MGYSVIDAKAGMPLCAPKETMEGALELVLQWRLPLSSVMWDSDTLRWVNIVPGEDDTPTLD